MKIRTLFENSNYFVVEKPSGLLAYPLPGSEEKTLGEITGGIPVHRLDRDTSGLMILAKNQNSKKKLQEIFKKREIKKIYITLVRGQIEPSLGQIKIPLGRGAKDRLKIVPTASGREALTVYRTIKYFPNADMSLIEAEIKTGRTHQIRVHFSSIGHPVVGDKKYSNQKSEIKRQFLHAARLDFVDPFDGERRCFNSDLPNDLKIFLVNLK